MANRSEDIQCVGSDTRPPMLDRTDFASWQQWIRLYCQGKENEVNILKSIDKGPFQMETLRETLTEGALHLGPERPRVYSDLTSEEKDRMQLNSKFVNNMLLEWGRFVTAVKLNSGLRDSNYDQLYAYLKQHEGRQNKGYGNNARGAGAAGYGGAQNRVGYANPGQARQIKGYNCNADDCDAFDYDVDEAPTAQTMFMDNLSFADPVYDEADPSYDSNVLFEVHDHDHYQDAVCKHREVHEMHDDVQPNYVVESHTGYTIDSNMIPYDQYVKDNAVQVVQSDVSAVPNDAYMMILNDMHEPSAQHVYVTTQTKVVDKSLTAELATYKEQVELYERWVGFELTEREQKIDEQLRIVITDRNIKEENLKKELYSVKMQLASTINHNKSMVEEVTSLKKNFKQKENQYLEEFLDMKALKEKTRINYSNKTSLFKHFTCSVNQNLTMMNKERESTLRFVKERRLRFVLIDCCLGKTLPVLKLGCVLSQHLHKGESIHDYYVRFDKLINDMRNIKMTMSRMQLNSKFVNNMLLEWDRFVIAVKLNRGLRDSNYDQLYAYLKKHETHAKENKMMLEQFSQNTVDPLVLMSNVSNPHRYSPSSSTSSSTQVPQPLADNPHLDSSLSPA
nr:retrovirus-related Pol polyprotein from transposon TNT 1-94 [Tanacetum cinerariifolium]